MSASDPIAPDRLEALLRGEAGADGRERRIGALLDELTVGEIAPPAELRERVRSLSAAPVGRLPRRAGCGACACAGRACVSRPRSASPRSLAVIVGVAATQTRHRPPRARTAAPDGGRRSRRSASPSRRRRRCRPAAPASLRRAGAPEATARPSAPAARRSARAGLRGLAPARGRQRRRALALDPERARHRALARRRRRDRRLRHAQRRQRQRGDRPARPVGRAQEALRRFSALGTITAQQVQIRDLQAGLDQESNRARALRHRIDLLKAKLLSPVADGRRARDAREPPRGFAERARERPARRPRDAAARRIRPLLARSRHRPRHGDRAAGSAGRRSSARPTTPSA